jgi:hypothetical protein
MAGKIGKGDQTRLNAILCETMLRAKQEIARICGAVSAGCRCKHGFVNKSGKPTESLLPELPLCDAGKRPTSIPVILKVVGTLAPNHLPA